MAKLHAAAKPGQGVVCMRCGHGFPQDPPFEVTCPACGAGPGQYCKRPSGHSGPFVEFHASRDLEALRLGFYDHDGVEGCGPNSDSIEAQALLSVFSAGELHDSPGLQAPAEPAEEAQPTLF
jgi:hypothetical protein